MADETDLADDIINTILAARIEDVCSQPLAAKATGYCLFCYDPIEEPGRRWCDSDCRDDWEEENIE